MDINKAFIAVLLAFLMGILAGAIVERASFHPAFICGPSDSELPGTI